MENTNYEALFRLFKIDPMKVVGAINLLGILLTVILVWAVIWYFVSAIGFRKMYKKAGQAGWKAFIPYYRYYIRYKIAWKPMYYWIYLLTMLLVQFLPVQKNVALDILAVVSSITLIVVCIKADLKLAKAFGKGNLCGVLLFFFPFIVSLVLGFGKAEYIGNMEEKV